jgi:hypothetical protein
MALSVEERTFLVEHVSVWWRINTICSTTIWPPRSPDLSPPDFFLWGVMKNSVYLNNPHTLDDLKMAIKEYIRKVNHAILNMVFENTVRRVNKCLEAGGGGDTLNITCNFLYCNHQAHRILITQYILYYILAEIYPTLDIRVT